MQDLDETKIVFVPLLTWHTAVCLEQCAFSFALVLFGPKPSYYLNVRYDRVPFPNGFSELSPILPFVVKAWLIRYFHPHVSEEIYLVSTVNGVVITVNGIINTVNGVFITVNGVLRTVSALYQ